MRQLKRRIIEGEEENESTMAMRQLKRRVSSPDTWEIKQLTIAGFPNVNFDDQRLAENENMEEELEIELNGA